MHKAMQYMARHEVNYCEAVSAVAVHFAPAPRKNVVAVDFAEAGTTAADLEAQEIEIFKGRHGDIRRWRNLQFF